MDFLILILINITLGVIFYLIISLKLEKSASEFREKKLHAEMNKIINEFNITAERNITILESRIKILQNLLKQHGHIPSLDMVVDEEKNGVSKQPSNEFDIVSDHNEDNIDLQGNGNQELILRTDRSRDNVSLLIRIKRVVSLIFRLPVRTDSQFSLEYEKRPVFNNERLFQHSFKKTVSHEEAEFSIEKEYSNHEEIVDADTQEDIDCSQRIKAEISDLINQEMNVYEVINHLHSRGMQVNEIARYVGIPEGEIKLVLNLNNSI